MVTASVSSYIRNVHFISSGEFNNPIFASHIARPEKYDIIDIHTLYISSNVPSSLDI